MTAAVSTQDDLPSAYSLGHTIALLTRTPVVLDALLRGLPDYWTRRNEGGDTWNAFDIVGHLIHSERSNWMERVHLILESGQTRTFDSFDRWAQQRDEAAKLLDELLDEFRTLRARSLGELRAMNLNTEQLARSGNHPIFGTVKLSELLATWAAHDLTHLHQLSRLMAYQIREEVGPWRKFLGVMQCDGHSS